MVRSIRGTLRQDQFPNNPPNNQIPSGYVSPERMNEIIQQRVAEARTSEANRIKPRPLRSNLSGICDKLLHPLMSWRGPPQC